MSTELNDANVDQYERLCTVLHPFSKVSYIIVLYTDLSSTQTFEKFDQHERLCTVLHPFAKVSYRITYSIE